MDLDGLKRELEDLDERNASSDGSSPLIGCT